MQVEQQNSVGPDQSAHSSEQSDLGQTYLPQYSELLW